MRNAAVLLIYTIVCCSLTAATTYWIVDPIQMLNETQKIALDEYLKAYCIKEKPENKAMFIGTTSALSRVVIRSNLGPVALAEYQKCKVLR